MEIVKVNNRRLGDIVYIEFENSGEYFKALVLGSKKRLWKVYALALHQEVYVNDIYYIDGACDSIIKIDKEENLDNMMDEIAEAVDDILVKNGFNLFEVEDKTNWYNTRRYTREDLKLVIASKIYE